MKNLLSNIKKGIGWMRDKTVEKIIDIGSYIKDKENRIIIGLLMIGAGSALVMSVYIKIPE